MTCNCPVHRGDILYGGGVQMGEKILATIKAFLIKFRELFMPRRENPQTVQNWVNWLNTNYGNGWMPIDGFTAIITSIPASNNTATYNPARGYPLKSFVNTNTGEVKSFDARRFYQ